MIPVITEAGYRAVAADLLGFGRSDKPARQGDYTYARHVDWIKRFGAVDRHRVTQLVLSTGTMSDLT